MQRRPYGKTGEQLSILGFGGIVVRDTRPAEASALVAEAVDRGVNYFDVAPSYGNAEECLGPALAPYRQRVFLACKTAKRDRAGAEEELNRSLKRLQTDHFDLYQMHGVAKMEEARAVLAPGGALETLVEAKRQGKVRFLGFSAHSVEVALTLMDAFPFDSVLFPINFVNYYQGNFGPQVVARAREKGMACLALKAMARTKWAQGAPRAFPKCWYEPFANIEGAELALRFTLSQPITAAIPPGEAPLFRLALVLAEQFKPITPDEEAHLRTIASGLEPIFRHTA